MKIAAQLYTVRDLAQKDFAATVRQVASIGYAGVELAGYDNLKSAADVRKATDAAGLQIAGGHVAIDQLETALNRVMDDFAILGCKTIIAPWLIESRRNDYLKLAKDLTAIAEKLNERGFILAYHNHSFEFQKFSGKFGLDLLWSNSDSSRVKSELDLYWVAHGGVDPIAYMKQLGRSRLVSVHLKDMDKLDRDKFAPVGDGQLDFAALVRTADELGVEWGVVEQDSCYDLPPMESLRRSFNHLKKLGAADSKVENRE